LDTFWKIRDKEGFILNHDGTRSACVHQWDRFHDEVIPFLRSTFIENRRPAAIQPPAAKPELLKTVAVVKATGPATLPVIERPVLGPRPVNGTKPMLGIHSGRDAIFALACNYPLDLYQFFVGSLRKFGYTDDIVLAVSPKNQMGGGVYDYIKQTNVVAYGFEVDCKGKDQCKLKDEFLG
jgi:hypothetical protein